MIDDGSELLFKDTWTSSEIVVKSIDILFTLVFYFLTYLIISGRSELHSKALILLNFKITTQMAFIITSYIGILESSDPQSAHDSTLVN